MAAGVKTTLPLTRLTVPLVASCTLTRVSGLPSTSVSFASSVPTGIVNGVSSTAPMVSGLATGASLTAAMSKVMRFGVVSKAPPESCTEKVKLA